jgi:hypothetical protein
LTIRELLDILSQGGILGLLVLIIYGGYKRYWVWGWSYSDKVREADEWKRLALSGTALAEKAIGVAKRDQETETR